MTMCMCFVFQVLLLVDMSLLVLSGPQPILNLKFALLFQIWWSLSILSRYISWPRKNIFSTYRHYLAPALSRVFYHFSHSHGRRFQVFFSACYKCNFITFWISSFNFWTHGSRAACSRCFPIPGEKLLRHLQLVTLAFADTSVRHGTAYDVFPGRVQCVCTSAQGS